MYSTDKNRGVPRFNLLGHPTKSLRKKVLGVPRLFRNSEDMIEKCVKQNYNETLAYKLPGFRVKNVESGT